jgi:hypothetical protein
MTRDRSFIEDNTTKQEDHGLDEMINDQLKEEPSGVQTVKALFKTNTDNDGKNDIDFKTEFHKDSSLKAVLVLEVLQSIENLDLTDRKFVAALLCDKYKRLNVSYKRQGRTEAVSIFKNEIGSESKMNNILGKMFMPHQ